MICGACVTAGALNERRNAGDARATVEAVEFWHEQCERPGACDCQHRVGVWS